MPLSAASGGATAAAKIAQNGGFLDFLNQNAVAIGLAFTALTFLVHLVSTAISIYIKVKKK